MTRTKTAYLAFLGTFLAPFAANATIIEVADRATFDSLVGATTLIDFEAQQTDGVATGITLYGGNLTVGDVSFTQSDNRLFVLDSSIYGTSATSNYLNHNDVGSAPVVVNFAVDVYSIGMDIGWLANWGGSTDPSTMTFLLSTGESFSQTIVGPLANTGTPMGFVGFYSDVAFSSLTILDSSDSVMIDNFAFGGSVAVPEPGTLSLLVAGLLGFGARRRYRKA